MCDQNGKYVLLRQTCGPARAVPVDCGDPLCPSCEKMRAREIREHWQPVVQSMRYPVLLTPTITKDRSDLKDRIKFYNDAISRLWDIRLGKRNRPVFLQQAIEFTHKHFTDKVSTGDITQQEAERIIASWEKSLLQFDKRLGKMTSPRVREVMGYGIGLFECPLKDGDWTPHRHLVIDTRYLPWPYLVVLWRRATKGAGEIVDIRPIGKTEKDLKEVFKYLTKSWEVPADRRAEFRDAVRGIKRVLVLGNAKPVEVDKPCPFCGEVSCRPHLVGMGESVTRIKVLGLDILKVLTSDIAGDLGNYFYLDKGSWRECKPEVVDLILRELACHSTPAPPAQPRLSGWNTTPLRENAVPAGTW